MGASIFQRNSVLALACNQSRKWRCKREMLEKLNDTLNSLNLNITHVYSDNNFAYHDVISHKILKIGKKNTQKIERKHLTFRTRLKRLARKTICYSKSLEMHKILIGLLINLFEFSSKLL